MVGVLHHRRCIPGRDPRLHRAAAPTPRRDSPPAFRPEASCGRPIAERSAGARAGRDVGLAVPGLAGPVLPGTARPGPLAGALRRPVRHRRVEQRLLPATGAGNVRGLGSPHPARFRDGGQGEPLPHPYPAPARPRRAGPPPARPRPPARRQARPGAAAAPAHAPIRRGRARPDPARVPAGGAGRGRAAPRELVPRRGPRPAGRARRTPLWRTADWTYLRLHQGTATPRPCYGRQALATWAGRLADLVGPDADAYVYFNNDPAGCAVRDARVFALAAARAGLRPTRVPAASEVRVG